MTQKLQELKKRILQEFKKSFMNFLKEFTVFSMVRNDFSLNYKAIGIVINLIVTQKLKKIQKQFNNF